MTATAATARKSRTNAVKAITGGRWAATAVRTTGTDTLVTKVQTFNTDTDDIAAALIAAGFAITSRTDIGAGMTNLFI